MKNLKLIIISMVALFSATNGLAMQRNRHISYSSEQHEVSEPLPPYIDWTEYGMAQAMEQMHVYAEQQKRAQELKELNKRRAREKTRMKPITEIAAISALKELLAQPSLEGREKLLNTLPIEMQEYLIQTIDNRLNLLDTTVAEEAEHANKLQKLREELSNKVFIDTLFVE